MSIIKNNIQEKLDQFTSHWTPHIIAELNGQAVKIAKIKGDFIWHKHDEEDEMFWVIKGCMKMELRDQTLILHEGDFTVIPKGCLLYTSPSPRVQRGSRLPSYA